VVRAAEQKPTTKTRRNANNLVGRQHPATHLEPSFSAQAMTFWATLKAMARPALKQLGKWIAAQMRDIPCSTPLARIASASCGNR
jgi:hypothetical protein